MASLYIHIPFCLGKCEYCSFNSYPGMEALFSRYVAAVNEEVVHHFFSGKTGTLDTIFFGGGTPSILSADQIGHILGCCREYFGVSDEAEITLEANPKTLDFMKLLQLRQAGINRISIGVQSFIDAELAMLGRLHSAQNSQDCVRDAIGAGFTDISLDLMYGVPGQTPEQWRWNLECALALEPTHLSLYQLGIEEGTPFAVRHQRGEIELPAEGEIVTMDELSIDLCRSKGLEQYEISNFARPGHECLHNLNYWYNLDYIAAGAGAVGFYQGERTRNVSEPRSYCQIVERGDSLLVESEKLSPEASFRETVIMGLRMVKGVSSTALFERFNIRLQEYYGDTLTPLLADGYVEFTDTHFRLTKKGRFLANRVLTELV